MKIFKTITDDENPDKPKFKFGIKEAKDFLKTKTEDENPDKPKIKFGTKDAKIFLNTALFLLIAVLIYIILAAVAMTVVERSHELEENNRIAAQRRNTSNYTELQEELTLLLTSEMAITLDEAKALLNNFTMAVNDTQVETNKWDYWGSFFYLVTLFTTIGYGKTAPQTTAGRVWTVIFALTGIPLALALFYKLGKYLKMFTEWTVKRYKTEKNKTYWDVAETIAFPLATFLFLILLPAGFFTAFESWNYFDSFYYCVITLTTVGFGDFVPALKVSGSLQDFYRLCVSCWILFGLSCVFVIIEQVQQTADKIAERYAKKQAEKKEQQTKEEEEES